MGGLHFFVNDWNPLQKSAWFRAPMKAVWERRNLFHMFKGQPCSGHKPAFWIRSLVTPMEATRRARARNRKNKKIKQIKKKRKKKQINKLKKVFLPRMLRIRGLVTPMEATRRARARKRKKNDTKK